MPPRNRTRQSRTWQLAAEDRRFLWHPFTQMRDWEREPPLIIERARGAYLFDTQGRRYLDGVSSLWVNVHGHRKRELDHAILTQVRRVAHTTLLGLASLPSIELAKRLVQLAPRGLSRVFFSDDGSTAVEVALKMALQYWQLQGRPAKQGFVSFVNAYHGDTIGAVSAGGIALFRGRFAPLLFKTYQVPTAYCYRCHLGLTYPACEIACLQDFERTLRRRHKAIAAVIIEPICQAAAGMLMPPAGYLRRVRELCSRYHVLLIADEVATGFGRTGRMFACEHERVAPDLLCLAKGLTGGYLPLAATLTTEAIYRAFLGEYKEFKTFFHGHSYTGNPLGCAVAVANLKVFAREQTLRRLQPKIRFLARQLRPLADLPHVGEVRQKGFMVGIELVKNRATRAAYPLEEQRGIRVGVEARARGLLIRPLGNVVVLMPPLSTTTGQLARMVRIVREAVEHVTAG